MRMNSQHPGAQLALIAEEAAGVILPMWRSGLTVDTKVDDSPVTEADRRGEALIMTRLTEAFPDVPVVAEEACARDGPPSSIGRRFFLVDALDGTRAFVRGEAPFTVNIGLIEDGVPVAGAVVAPATGQVWYTAPGGALKRQIGEADGRRIHVRPRGDAEVLALISHTLKPEQLEKLKIEYGITRGQPLDSSITLCVIAEGGADIYPRHGPSMEWDIAAGHAVLRAAGGSLAATDGTPFVYGKANEGFKNGWFVARGGW